MNKLISMKGVIVWIRKVAMVSTSGLMDGSIKETLKMIFVTDMDNFFKGRSSYTEGNGGREKNARVASD